MVYEKTEGDSVAVVNVSVANVYAEPAFMSEVVTQALLGEKLDILDTESNWHRVRQWDGYEGWIHEFFHAPVSQEYLHRLNSGQILTVRDLFASVHETDDLSSPGLRDLVYGNALVVLEEKEGWRKVLLPDGVLGWTDAEPQPSRSDFDRVYLVQEAGRFLGIQYLWGGKSPKGFDCSGYVQTVMKPYICLPRDSYSQAEHADLKEIELTEVKEGDLIFFSKNGEGIDHVAISIGGNAFIHCSGFVRTDTFGTASRIGDTWSGRQIVAVRSIKRVCR